MWMKWKWWCVDGVEGVWTPRSECHAVALTFCVPPCALVCDCSIPWSIHRSFATLSSSQHVLIRHVASFLWLVIFWPLCCIQTVYCLVLHPSMSWSDRLPMIVCHWFILAPCIVYPVLHRFLVVCSVTNLGTEEEIEDYARWEGGLCTGSARCEGEEVIVRPGGKERKGLVHKGRGEDCARGLCTGSPLWREEKGAWGQGQDYAKAGVRIAQGACAWAECCEGKEGDHTVLHPSFWWPKLSCVWMKGANLVFTLPSDSSFSKQTPWACSPLP